MQTLITRKNAKISTPNATRTIAGVPRAAAEAGTVRTATTPGATDRPRFLTALMYALSAFAT
jgi:hypothetical protein